jgi:heterodisulfide reductase subunit A-like polyferredoxin
MAVAKARLLEPLTMFEVPVTPKALIIGGGPAGLTAALSLAEQGFQAYLVERERELGGTLRRLHSTAEFTEAGRLLDDLLRRTDENPLIEVITGATVASFSGHAGHFTTLISFEGRGKGGRADAEVTLEHGVVIVATGTVEAEAGALPAPGAGFPAESPAGLPRHVLGRLDFENELRQGLARLPRDGHATVVFALCDGSNRYCSRTCCTQAVKAALEVADLRPEADIYVLYRDLVTYGFFENLYRKARERGVRFIRFPDGEGPRIAALGDGSGASVEVTDSSIGARLVLRADIVVLGTPAVPAPGTTDLARVLKVALTPDGFFSELHAKLGPVDLPATGLFVAGGAHGPKHLSEVILQAEGAAARAATILAKTNLTTGGIVAEVNPEKCAACLTCVRVCPYRVPFIDDDAVAQIDPVQCRGCGTCAGDCPAKAIQLPYYRDDQLAAIVTELFRAAV